MLTVGPLLLIAQTTVHGRVVDRETREPLEFAVVRDRAGGSALTDHEGRFRLPVRGRGDSLEVSYVGYAVLCVCAGQCCDDPACCRDGVCGRGMELMLGRRSVDLGAVTIVPSPNASFHTISQADLSLRPVNSAQDLMRLVPGLFLGQHQGGGLAEHIFYRGFDADHGTDVNVSVDGMPVNLVSHIHGQGFADLHFLIPELVSKYDYGKGPYYAGYGDFTTAGYVGFRTFDVLDRSEVKLEGGPFNTGRVLAKIKADRGYLAGEAVYSDGPFEWAQHMRRFNLFGKYNFKLSSRTRLTATFSGFESRWRSSGEIPERAVEDGVIGRFGYIDSAQGGNTGRESVILRLRTEMRSGWLLENQAWYAHYYFGLHYDPTFFADDSINGDQLRQRERRDLAGYAGRLTRHDYFSGGGDLLSAVGIGAQGNWLGLSDLSHTVRQDVVLDTLQAGKPREYALNAWADENYHFGRWLVNAGARLDWLHFGYRDIVGSAQPGRAKAIVSPKLNLSYTHSRSLQVYLKMGKGFHSNDARVVVANRGLDVLPAAYGMDLGVNWKPAPRLIVNAVVWTLYLQQEFVYDADEGTMEPGGRTRRQGVDLSARYQLTPWLFANLDINYCRARGLDAVKGQDYLPLAVPLSSTGGLDFRLRNGISGGLSYRYMKDRPANADNSLVAQGYFVTDLTANYIRSKWEVGLEVQNLLDTKWREAQFETTSRMLGERQAVDGISYTPGMPLFGKVKFGVFF